MTAEYSTWLGRSRSTSAHLDPWPVRALSAVLGFNDCEAAIEVPQPWHWLYFLEAVAGDEIGPDGHPRLGGFMPPLPNPRRMFAGARIEYLRPLRLGGEATLTESISNIQTKSGSAGELYIVTVEYEYSQDGQRCIVEQRDFVYLPAVVPGRQAATLEPRVAPIADAQWSLDVATDPVLLFRFSALTFNAHRIHYDRDYAVQQEAYPDLVVQGPLTAVLAAQCLRRNTTEKVRAFTFRAVNPLFVGQPIRIRGTRESATQVSLIAYAATGKPAMKINATLEGVDTTTD